MTKEEENDAIKALHLPSEVKRLEQENVDLRKIVFDLQSSLRDQFATAALTGWLADSRVSVVPGEDEMPIAKGCYRLADAMLQARKC